jgi:protein O-mannosyl-transferase
VRWYQLSATVARLLAAVLLLVFATGLYWPFLANPLVFDDGNIFYSPRLTQAAIEPWVTGIRGFPYFTLGLVETLIGSIQAHRVLSLALHALVAYQWFRFLEELLSTQRAQLPDHLISADQHIRLVALLIALAFVVHPAAVYGAGYLVQRTIVFAALFSLLGLRCLLRALEQGDVKQAAIAAFWMSCAILSKEHAMSLPCAALGLLGVTSSPWTSKRRVVTVFLLLCAPAVVLAIYQTLHAAFTPYEPGLHELVAELYGLPVFADRSSRWLHSAANQAQLFFGYWGQWLWPAASRMSVDLRVDFLRPLPAASAWTWLLCWAGVGLAAAVAGLRFRFLSVAAFGIFFTVVLFSTELVVVRFQEPYVLYRSYLWAIGYGALAAALLIRLPTSIAVGALALAVPVLAFQAVGRLETFTSKRALWEDAAAKLPTWKIAGSSRILFNRGLARFQAGDQEGAMQDIDLAIAQNPSNGRYKIARAVSLLHRNQAQDALIELQAAQALLPGDADAVFLQFFAFKALARTEEAEAALLVAAKLGSHGAKNEIARRLSKNGSVTLELQSGTPAAK